MRKLGNGSTPRMDWQKYAWIKRGSRRQKTLELLSKANNPQTINDIHQKSKIAISQASATVAELEKTGLISCLNPRDKIGKLYVITDEGREIITKINAP
jgi:DNA-binding MarR family transcriptional regulator